MGPVIAFERHRRSSAVGPALADMALGLGRTMLIAGWPNPTAFMVTKLQL